MPCPVCSASELRRIVTGPGEAWSLWYCPHCLIYPVLPSAPVHGREMYGQGYFEHSDIPTHPAYSGYLSYERKRSVMKEDLAEMLRPFIRAGARVLDIGCATGVALETARDAGVEESDLCGLDISMYAIAQAQSYLPRARLVCGDVREMSLEGTYNVVLLLDVVEHVEDPSALFRAASRRLAPGGRLLLTTPDPESFLRRWFGVRWSEFRYGEHLCFIGQAWLARMALETGLKLLTNGHRGKRVSLTHAASRLRAYLPWLPRFQSQTTVYLNPGDQLFAVFERSRI